MPEAIVGMTHGDSEPHECNAVIVSPEIGIFDFLAAGDILTQISELEIKSNITIADAKKMALGETKDIRQDVLATLDVIGHINGEVTRSLQPIMPGTPLFEATPEQITKFLGFDLTDNMIHIGELLRRSDVPVVIARDWFLKHISIMGMTGAGKSNLAKVILDALKSWYNDTIIIVDPHGEYEGEQVRVDDILGDTKDLDFELVVERAFEIIGKKDKDFRYLIEIAYASSTIRNKKLSKVDALLEACNDYYVRGASSYKSIMLEAIKTETIIQTVQGKIIKHDKKKPLVFDLRGVKHEVGESVVNIIAELVLELGKTGRSIITVIDEVQLYCNQRKKSLSKEAIINLISEGRKFGCGVVIMSQRPAKVDKDIISQCNTKFCLQVTNENDIRQVRSSTEYATRDMFREVQKLQCGQALLSSPWLKRPVFVSIREYIG